MIGPHIGKGLRYWLNSRRYDLWTLWRYVRMPENERDGIRMLVSTMRHLEPLPAAHVWHVELYIEAEHAGMCVIGPEDESGNPADVRTWGDIA